MLDHLRLTVADVSTARRFYDLWLRRLGFAPVEREDGGAAWGRRDGERMRWLILTPSSHDAPHDPRAPGLHHVAFAADSRAQVDAVHALLDPADVLEPPSEYDDDPDSYAVFFRDPDGFKLEVVHVTTRWGT